jgi:hypothetical protein
VGEGIGICEKKKKEIEVGEGIGMCEKQKKVMSKKKEAKNKKRSDKENYKRT